MGPCSITFGHNGKPTYIPGPYDDTDHIIRTLRRTVERKGFSYTTAVDLSQLPPGQLRPDPPPVARRE